MLIHSTVTVPVGSSKRLYGHPYFREIRKEPGFVIFSIAMTGSTKDHKEYNQIYYTAIEVVRQMGIPAFFTPESMFQNVVSLKYTEDGEADIQKLTLESYVNGLLGLWPTYQDDDNFTRFFKHKCLWENQIRYGNIHTLKHFME